MADLTLKPAGGTVIRLTQLDPCGNPTGCYIVSRCWASVAEAPQYADSVEFAPTNADGSLCFAYRQPPSLKWFAYELMFNAVTPIAWQIASGAAVELDDAAGPNTVGWRYSRGQLLRSRFAMEMWLNNGGTSDCNHQWLYRVIPRIVQAKLADLVVGKDIINFSLTEALGVAPSPWGVGPYNIRLDQVTGVPEPLIAAIGVVEGDEDFEGWQTTGLGPPDPTSGCQPIAPTFAVAPGAGAHPLAVVATLPLSPAGTPIVPGKIDWGDGSGVSTITVGPTTPHSYAVAGSYTATYKPTAVSAPTYTANTVVVA